jgi:hypothetical protein
MSFNGEVCIPSGKKNDCRERFHSHIEPRPVQPHAKGDFGAIFNAYGLELGVISDIDVYSVSIDFL